MALVTEGHRFFEGEVQGLLDSLYGAALRLTRNHADAEDLVAEAVARAWAGFESLHDRGCFRAWIFRILTNVFISEHRRAKAVSLEAAVEDPEQASDEAEFSLFDKLHRPFLLWWSNPEQEFLDQILRADIERALDTLPEAFRVVVVLGELQGFSYREIADMLDVPIGTVRSRLARGRAMLQKLLWAQAQEAGLRRVRTAKGPDQGAPERL